MSIPEPELPVNKNIKANQPKDDAASQTHNPGDEAGGGHASPPRPPPNVPHPPEDPGRPLSGYQPPHVNGPSWCEKGLFWLELVGILGLVWYCCINQGELKVFREESETMSHEVQVTRQQITDAESGQRAWLRIQEIGYARITNSPYPSWYQVQITWVVKNYGATPAIDMAFPGAVFNENTAFHAYVSGDRNPMPATGGPSLMPQESLTNTVVIGGLPNGQSFQFQQWVDFRDVFQNAWTVGAFGSYSYSNDVVSQTGFYTDQFHHAQSTTNQNSK
jgi:hypothetical protein